MSFLTNSISHVGSGIVTPQGTKSSTFRPPPLDGSLTVPELFQWHAKNSPMYPVLIYTYPQAISNGALSMALCYHEVYRAIGRAANITKGLYLQAECVYSKQPERKENEPPVFGILAVADTISYFTLIVAIMHLGFTPFPISTRNSALGIAHLLKQTGVIQMFVSADPAMQRLAADAICLAGELESGDRITVLEMPQFEQLYAPNGKNDEVDTDKIQGKMNSETIALIVHSSGSTAFPKPIKFTNYTFIRWGMLPYYGGIDICDRPIATHSLPMFHAMGGINIVWTTCAGSIVSCFAPASPPTFPTPELVLDAIVASKSELVFCVPAFIEAWARDPQNLPKLKAIKTIVFGGAPLNPGVGEALSAAGVRLTPFYGTTETGSIGTFVPAEIQQDEWQYFKVSPHIDVEMVPQEGLDGVFMPVVLASETFSPHVLNTEVDGRGAFITWDLLEVHPTKPGFYKVYGRADDQLMLSTGEKTNPIPLENIFVQDPLISAAIIFGRGRFQNGVLIQPSTKAVVDPHDEDSLSAFRNQIWDTVEKVNEYAPAHSRLFKEMILVTDPAKFTPKGTPRRQVCIAAYSAEIDAVYEKVKDSSQTELIPPITWTEKSTLEFVDTIVRRVVSSSGDMGLEDDLFQQGCDSLQATWIRNTILHALRVSTKISLHDVPFNFVYTNPSIGALGRYVYKTVQSPGSSPASEVATNMEEMRAFVDKYQLKRTVLTSREGPHAATSIKDKNSRRDVVLITGTTGRFGCHLLAQLLADDGVSCVYALNRQENDSGVIGLERRQTGAFNSWGLDISLLSPRKLVYLVGNLSDKNLGPEEDVYAKLTESVNIVVHNAWRVDFNLRLSSFERLLSGVHKLLELCSVSTCAGGTRFVFVSSISTLLNHSTSDPATEDSTVDPALAAGGGYAESKWVAEQIIVRATNDLGLRGTVVRVRQLSGDTQMGGWTTKEWVPAIVHLSQKFGCVPTRNERLSWVAVDTAASALLDITQSAPHEPILHLVSPQQVEWDTIFGAIADRLALPLLPYEEWVAKLRSSHLESSSVSGMSLLDFFERGKFGEHVPFSTDKAIRYSPTLAQYQELKPEDAIRWTEYWLHSGFLQADGK